MAVQAFASGGPQVIRAPARTLGVAMHAKQGDSKGARVQGVVAMVMVAVGGRVGDDTVTINPCRLCS